MCNCISPQDKQRLNTRVQGKDQSPRQLAGAEIGTATLENQHFKCTTPKDPNFSLTIYPTGIHLTRVHKVYAQRYSGYFPVFYDQRLEANYRTIHRDSINAMHPYTEGHAAVRIRAPVRMEQRDICCCFVVAPAGKESAALQRWVQSLCWEDPLEVGITAHSVFLP